MRIKTGDELQAATARGVYNIDKATKASGRPLQRLSKRRSALVWLFNQLAGMDKNTPRQN